MKICAILLLLALAFAPLALAKVSITPEALGQVEGLLNFCSSVNPNLEANRKGWEKQMFPEATKEELKKLRDSSEYKEAYDFISKELAKIPKDKAVEACNAIAAKK